VVVCAITTLPGFLLLRHLVVKVHQPVTERLWGEAPP
jgi:hypothetical protein